MGDIGKNMFSPDYAIHPGEILEETLEARGIKKNDFAIRCGLSPKTVSLVINGRSSITPDTAIQFERVLGTSAALWLNLDARYNLFMARKSDMKELRNSVEWAKGFPLADLKKRGIIPKTRDDIEIVKSIFEFFSVGSVDAWAKKYNSLNVEYRKSPSFKSSSKAVIAWLRLGEIAAEEIPTDLYDESYFKDTLRDIRTITSKDPETFVPKMIDLCAKSGVALVFVPELPKTYLSGATFWLNKDKAIIILSLRHKRDDHFWFSFFHEAGHILLHGKRMIFIDEKDGNFAVDTVLEKEADQFASNFLIPDNLYDDFTKESNCSKDSILEFSDSLEIAPGIVVGRLQHDEQIPYDWHNRLKRIFVFKETE